MKFLNEEGTDKLFPSVSNGLGPSAVHPVNKVFAIADIDVDPTIRVYDFPEFNPVNELKGL